MKNLLFLLAFSIISTGLFAQDIPIPKKEKLLAEFGNQLVTFSKKAKSVNIHFKDNTGSISTHSIDFSEKKGISKLIKRFQMPVIGSINTPESALEKFKIYKQGDFLYVTCEFKDQLKHHTDASVFNSKTNELTRKEIFSVPEGLQGVAYKIKGTSCILDGKLFQTYYNGFYYGIAIHDLENFERKADFSTQIPNPIEFKNSGIVYIRDVKGFKLFKKDKKKRISNTSFFRNLNTDLPFICASKNEDTYYLTLGCYNRKEYDEWWKRGDNFFGNSMYSYSHGIHVGGSQLVIDFNSYSKNSIIFFSSLNAETLEHIPNE